MPNGYDEINIGPFVGGLNTLSDQTAIGDTELFRCDNFELDQDGSLVSRPPIRKTSTSLAAGKALKLLGYYVDTTTGNSYLIGTDRTANTYYLSSGNWTLITATFAASAVLQYNDKLYLVAPLSSANPGGTWTLAGGFVADNNMPKGVCIVQNKARLWIAQGKGATSNGSRIYVSDIVSGAPSWAGNYIEVSKGDGENVVDLCVYLTDLVIFKQKSTWRFSFGNDPASGYLTNVSPTIGISNTGCYVAWETQIFVVYNNDVYEFINYNFNKLNITAPLYTDNPSIAITEKIGISAWADRVFISYYEKLFVYNLRNRTWSTWSSDRVVSFGRFFPVPFMQSERPIAYLYSTQAAGVDGTANVLFEVVDLIEPSDLVDESTFENFVCKLETKNYDYQSPSTFKRLKFWGVDALTRADINVFAQPVQYARQVTWGELATRTWADVKLYSWGSLADTSIVVADTVQINSILNGRKFIKFLKSLRFRQISFQLQTNTTGSSNDAPVRIYRLTTYVKVKELVPKKVN